MQKKFKFVYVYFLFNLNCKIIYVGFYMFKINLLKLLNLDAFIKVC